MSVISLSSPGLRGGSVCGGGVVWRCEIGTAPISSGISGFQNRIAVVVEQRLFILTCHHVTTLWHSVTILRQAFNEPSVHFYSLCQSLWPVTDPFCSVCDCCVTRQCGLVWIYSVFRWVSMCLAQHLEHVLSRLSWHCFNMWQVHVLRARMTTSDEVDWLVVSRTVIRFNRFGDPTKNWGCRVMHLGLGAFWALPKKS